MRILNSLLLNLADYLPRLRFLRSPTMIHINGRIQDHFLQLFLYIDCILNPVLLRSELKNVCLFSKKTS